MKTHAALLISVALVVFAKDAQSAPAEKKEVPTRYSYTDLGTLASNSCSAGGIKGGFVAGTSGADAFLFHKGAMEDIGTLKGGTWSNGSAVNAAGQVTGNASIQNAPVGGGAFHAFLYSNGVMRDLGTLGGNSIGHAINSAGHVVGDTDSGGAFLYKNGKMESIALATALGINSSGDVVGSVKGSAHAGLYSHGSVTDLNTLLSPVDAPYITLQRATGISNNGIIVAKGVDLRMPSLDGSAFLIANGTVTNLGSFGGGAANPSAVNSDGEVVGAALLSNFTTYHAFTYKDGTLTDLNTVIDPSRPLPSFIFLQDAVGITKKGVILAVALDTQVGENHCYVLKPIKH